jgi:hypothetical protein
VLNLVGAHEPLLSHFNPSDLRFSLKCDLTDLTVSETSSLGICASSSLGFLDVELVLRT